MQHISAAAPLALLILLAICAAFLKKAATRFQLPKPFESDGPLWPSAENPGLALQLAGSMQDVDAVLGKAASATGAANRQVAIELQKLDVPFILLYVLFFLACAAVLGGWSAALPVAICVLLTAAFDLLEDRQIVRVANGGATSFPRRFGQAKWLFYFATLAASGLPFFLNLPERASRTPAGFLLGGLLIATGLGGAIAALKGSFPGVLSASKFSALGAVGLAVAPLVALAPFSWRDAALYVILMRVPILIALTLVALPLLAFFTGARTLLKGLFDLSPASLFVVTLSSMAVAGTACSTASIVLSHASERFGAAPILRERLPGSWTWLAILVSLTLPTVVFAVDYSRRQKRSVGSLLGAAAAGLAAGFCVVAPLAFDGSPLVRKVYPHLRWLENWLATTSLFQGYVQLDPAIGTDPFPDHLSGATAFLATLILYAGVGIYGWRKLGKQSTVPALASALMILMMLGWMLSGIAFFFDAWRVPVLLILAAVALLTAQSTQSDHFYCLRPRADKTPAPGPGATIVASKAERVIVVAANGGGIQAGAWAAQVLYGLLEEFQDPFQRSLRMISSVSGGSVGTACYVNWLVHRDIADTPPAAAAKSSLDEVSWGLAWTDFLRSFVPWLLGGLMGRGRALEKAWRSNALRDPEGPARRELDDPLSSWNAKVASGELPAVVMNATIAETGQRLLLATTELGCSNIQGRARMDARQLHTINGVEKDVSIVTAARLSATFPYVTPASRSDGAGPQPHIVDGGYYDNYGMATMVEWLDEALGDCRNRVKSVLVVQVHGSPVETDFTKKLHAQSRGWFFQALAPLTTLAAVRSAGQIAHNDIELGLLQQKWTARGIPVHTVTFEFHGPNAPLSWHLTETQKQDIRDAWASEGMGKKREKVRQFLQGNDRLECGCPRCIGAAAVA
jgi:hypothetical protein